MSLSLILEMMLPLFWVSRPLFDDICSTKVPAYPSLIFNSAVWVSLDSKTYDVLGVLSLLAFDDQISGCSKSL